MPMSTHPSEKVLAAPEELGLDSRTVPQGRLMAESEQLVAAFERRVFEALTRPA